MRHVIPKASPKTHDDKVLAALGRARRVSLPAAVVFDNDGLTLDTETVWSRAEVALFAELRAVFTHEHKLELVGNAGAGRGGRRSRPCSACRRAAGPS